MVALLAQNEYKGASCQHMSELLVRQKGIHISSKSLSRILKEEVLQIPTRISLVPQKEQHPSPKVHCGEKPGTDLSAPPKRQENLSIQEMLLR